MSNVAKSSNDRDKTAKYGVFTTETGEKVGYSNFGSFYKNQRKHLKERALNKIN